MMKLLVIRIFSVRSLFFFFFNDTATTEIYTLSLHDALPISGCPGPPLRTSSSCRTSGSSRSEEHTSELQSRFDLVCRLLLEKKKHLFILPALVKAGTNHESSFYEYPRN